LPHLDRPGGRRPNRPVAGTGPSNYWRPASQHQGLPLRGRSGRRWPPHVHGDVDLPNRRVDRCSLCDTVPLKYRNGTCQRGHGRCWPIRPNERNRGGSSYHDLCRLPERRRWCLSRRFRRSAARWRQADRRRLMEQTLRQRRILSECLHQIDPVLGGRHPALRHRAASAQTNTGPGRFAPRTPMADCASMRHPLLAEWLHGGTA
jgi:hypothetical protein